MYTLHFTERILLMKPIDLHVHSIYSDGTLTPSQLIDTAIDTGLAAMAITDHDTIDGIPEALEYAKTKSFELISGIEFSTFFEKKEIHIVGLFIDHTNKAFNHELITQRKSREEKNIKMCKKFEEIGIHISYEEMLEWYAHSVITRAHFADYLLKKGYVHDRNEAFSRYIGDGKPCFVERNKMLPERAIELIKKAGGVAILAHPILYHLGNEQMTKLINYLCQHGIDGLEAIYSTYSMSDQIQMQKLASRYHLLISGGSDYHGANKPHIKLGTGTGKLFVPYEVLEKLKKQKDCIQ